MKPGQDKMSAYQRQVHVHGAGPLSTFPRPVSNVQFNGHGQ